MAYTFGGGTGDDITLSLAANFGGTNRNGIVAGWFRPTTLTAGRGLWSFGDIIGAEIDTTTSEIRLKADNATTDGQWTTTGVGLTVDQWQFIAVAGSFSDTGPTITWRVWSGTATTPPTECTVTNAVAPVGNNTASSSFTIGNKGTGTVAFQGEIENLTVFAAQSTTSGAANVFNISTFGTITNAEAAFLFERFVAPCWYGNVNPEAANLRHGIIDCEHCRLDGTPTVVIRTSNNTPRNPTAFPFAVNGATIAATRGPRAVTGAIVHPPFLRR